MTGEQKEDPEVIQSLIARGVMELVRDDAMGELKPRVTCKGRNLYEEASEYLRAALATDQKSTEKNWTPLGEVGWPQLRKFL